VKLLPIVVLVALVFLIKKSLPGRDRVTRQDMYGKPTDLAIFLGLMIGIPCLGVYCLRKFQTVDPSGGPWSFRSALMGYAVVFVALLIGQRKLFPWGAKVPGMKWFMILGLPFLGAGLGLAVFSAGNALLDQSKPIEVVRLVEERWKSGEYILMSEKKVISGERLQTSWRAPRLPIGTRLVLTVRKGFFGEPWISSYRVQE
jgi:hypothetical protein